MKYDKIKRFKADFDKFSEKQSLIGAINFYRLKKCLKYSEKNIQYKEKNKEVLNEIRGIVENNKPVVSNFIIRQIFFIAAIVSLLLNVFFSYFKQTVLLITFDILFVLAFCARIFNTIFYYKKYVDKVKFWIEIYFDLFVFILLGGACLLVLSKGFNIELLDTVGELICLAGLLFMGVGFFIFSFKMSNSLQSEKIGLFCFAGIVVNLYFIFLTLRHIADKFLLIYIFLLIFIAMAMTCLLLKMCLVKPISLIHNKNLIAFVVLVFSLILNWIILIYVMFYDQSGTDNSLFSGIMSVFAATLGGILTLAGVAWTIKKADKDRQDIEKEAARPIFTNLSTDFYLHLKDDALMFEVQKIILDDEISAGKNVLYYAAFQNSDNSNFFVEGVYLNNKKMLLPIYGNSVLKNKKFILKIKVSSSLSLCTPFILVVSDRFHKKYYFEMKFKRRPLYPGEYFPVLTNYTEITSEEFKEFSQT